MNASPGPLRPRYALVLHPEDPTVQPSSWQALGEALIAVGLAGPELPCADGPRLLAGPRFLDLLTFLGCSPYVEVVPPTGVADPCQALARFCHLRVAPFSAEPSLRRSRQGPAPRCPRCRAPVEGEPTDLGAAVRTGTDWVCPHCGRASPTHALDWRQSAGAGQAFLEVWGIHPGEAVPGDELLAALAQLTGGPWRWFYEQA
ncbi:MAG: CpXC domain-containing protein [Gammaproteobacteria bacterium]|jgi:hypothetical protein|nr:CpXC domain-containing protein [Gammaproteobacteria bacterium]